MIASLFRPINNNMLSLSRTFAGFLTALFMLPVYANPSPSMNNNTSIPMNSIADDTRVFRVNPSVSAQDVRFHNRFGLELAGHLYLPKDFDASKKYPAVAVCGPFGAVKEQASGLYAQELASRGFVTVAFDPSFTGESSGSPRYVSSPDINTEDFCAAVDFLSLLPYVDASRVGILGICGWGGMALNAAAVDPRIRVTVACTMYDIHRVSANGYFDKEDSAEARDAIRSALAAQRLKDARLPVPETAGGVPDSVPEDAPQFVKDYHAYYKTERGYHPRSLNSNAGWNKTSLLSLLNTPLLAYTHEIKNAVLLVHGEKAHSRYFSETAFQNLRGDNKELLIVPGASHTDLYDNFDKIPFDKIEAFLRKHL